MVEKGNKFWGAEWIFQAEGGKIYKEDTKVAGTLLVGGHVLRLRSR
jgi:hypothetical protein